MREDLERRLDELLAKEQIREQMARYSRGIDRRDEEQVRAAYHEDSYDDHGWGLQAGGWDIAALVRRDGKGFPDEWRQTTHFLGQHLIEVDGDSARSEVYFVMWELMDDGAGGDCYQVLGGRYLDRWERREDGVFRISHRRIANDWWRHDLVSTRWPGPNHDVPKMIPGGAPLDDAGNHTGVAGPEDVSYHLFRS